MPGTKAVGRCGQCGRGPLLIQGRGLCRRCFSKPTLRGRHPRRCPWSRWDRDRVRALRRLAARGLSWWDVGAALGVSANTARKAAARYGVRSRFVWQRDAKGRYV